MRKTTAFLLNILLLICLFNKCCAYKRNFMKNFITLFFISLIFLFNKNISAYNSWHVEKLRSVEKTVWAKGVYVATLKSLNLQDADLQAFDLRRIDLSFSNFKNSNLSNADLSEANLSGALMKGVKLEETKVLRTNFAHVIGLTNEQKQYLIANGAINVPIKIEYDLYTESKISHERNKHTFLKRLLAPIVTRYKRCNSKNTGTQTKNKPKRRRAAT